MDAVRDFSFGGMADALLQSSGFHSAGGGHWIMAAIGFLFIILGIRGFAPLFFVPAGVGAVLANFPTVGIAEPGGIFYYFFFIFIHTGFLPLVLMFHIGWRAEFGPLVANPRLLFLGAAAQAGPAAAILMVMASRYLPGEPLFIDLREAASVGVLAGADGALAAYASVKVADHLVEVVTLSAFLYVALGGRITALFVRLLCSRQERGIEMEHPHPQESVAILAIPLVLLVFCVLLVPAAAPLAGMFALGNIMKVRRVVEVNARRIGDTATALMGLTIGIRLDADYVLSVQALAIFVIGLAAVMVAVAAGILAGKALNRFSGGHFNPAIGAAGVPFMGAAPEFAAQAVGDSSVVPHAAGANAAGIIGWIVATGVLLALL